MRLGYQAAEDAVYNKAKCFNEAEAHAPRIPVKSGTTILSRVLLQ